LLIVQWSGSLETLCHFNNIRMYVCMYVCMCRSSAAVVNSALQFPLTTFTPRWIITSVNEASKVRS